jgi:hypothetical protein
VVAGLFGIIATPVRDDDGWVIDDECSLIIGRFRETVCELAHTAGHGDRLACIARALSVASPLPSKWRLKSPPSSPMGGGLVHAVHGCLLDIY